MLVLVLGAAMLLTSAGAFAAPKSCTTGLGGSLVLPPVVALASGGNPTTDSGQSFKISCDANVNTQLRLYSASPRVMINGANRLPFKLSLISGAVNDDLAISSPGTALNIVRNGQGQTVTLYARILAQNFSSLPAGAYSTSVTLTLEY